MALVTEAIHQTESAVEGEDSVSKVSLPYTVEYDALPVRFRVQEKYVRRGLYLRREI